MFPQNASVLPQDRDLVISAPQGDFNRQDSMLVMNQVNVLWFLPSWRTNSHNLLKMPLNAKHSKPIKLSEPVNHSTRQPCRHTLLEGNRLPEFQPQDDWSAPYATLRPAIECRDCGSLLRGKIVLPTLRAGPPPKRKKYSSLGSLMSRCRIIANQKQMSPRVKECFLTEARRLKKENFPDKIIVAKALRVARAIDPEISL